jgi:segregation and condensation protein B
LSPYLSLLAIGGRLDAAPFVIERGLNELDASLATRGLRLQRHAGRVQLTTAPQLAELIERFLGLEATSHLSRAALETLAIIAYQQPVTRPQIDTIRGEQ